MNNSTDNVQLSSWHITDWKNAAKLLVCLIINGKLIILGFELTLAQLAGLFAVVVMHHLNGGVPVRYCKLSHFCT